MRYSPGPSSFGAGRHEYAREGHPSSLPPTAPRRCGGAPLQAHARAVSAQTDLAIRFLGVDDLEDDQGLDPLGLVRTIGGSPRVDTDSTLCLRLLGCSAEGPGWGRVACTGNAIQDILLHLPTGGPRIRPGTSSRRCSALARLSSTRRAASSRRSGRRRARHSGRPWSSSVGIARRDTKPEPEALDRAAEALKRILGEDVLPLEDQIADAVRTGMPAITERVTSCPSACACWPVRRRACRADPPRLHGPHGRRRWRRSRAARAARFDPRPGHPMGGGHCARVLGEGAEDDVRRAAETLRDLAEIFLLDPQAGAGLQIDGGGSRR